jgi:hypothetical protein
LAHDGGYPAAARFQIVTSIPPVPAGEASPGRGLAIAVALKSFEANGFRVVSVNRPEEIASLQPRYTTVDFKADDNGGLFKDRYGASFGAIFAACRDVPFAGVINADIYLVSGQIRRRLETAPDRFYVARRSDIAELGGPLLGTYKRGIDALFFSPAHYRPLLEDKALARFQLGAAFWDVALPVAASFHGEVAFLAAPFILHPVHPSRFPHTDYELLREQGTAAVLDHARRYADRSPSARRFLAIVERYAGQANSARNRRWTKAAVYVMDAWLDRLEQRSTIRAEVDLNDQMLRAAIGPILDRYAGRARAGNLDRDSRDGVPPPWNLVAAVRLALRRRRRERDRRGREALFAEDPVPEPRKAARR